MPHLRFSRDKRGYENTFVVHSGGRRRGKSRSRILYWFRTPPGVRVGRAALDEDAIRLIEEHNPEIDFDWTQILRGQQAEPKAEPPAIPGGRGRTQAPRRPRASGGDRLEPRVSVPPRADVDGRSVSAESVAEPQGPQPFEEPHPIEGPSEIEPLGFAAGLDEDDTTLAAGDPVPAGGVDDLAEPDLPVSAAAARLGPEGLLRLRARYAEVLARISERISDPARQEELKGQAERLNPDNWVTDREVGEGLEQYEAVFDSLRAVVGRRRRRRRRRGGDHAVTPPNGSGGPNAAVDTQHDSNSPSETDDDEG